MEDLKHQAEARKRFKLLSFWGLLWDCGVGKTRAAVEIVEDKVVTGDEAFMIITPAFILDQWKDGINSHSRYEHKVFIKNTQKMQTKKGKAAWEDFLHGHKLLKNI